MDRYPKHLSGIHPTSTVKVMKVVSDVEASFERSQNWITKLESKNHRRKDDKTPENRNLFHKTKKLSSTQKNCSNNKETVNLDSDQDEYGVQDSKPCQLESARLKLVNVE